MLPDGQGCPVVVQTEESRQDWLSLLDPVQELAQDWLRNGVPQKLFDTVAPSERMQVAERVWVPDVLQVRLRVWEPHPHTAEHELQLPHGFQLPPVQVDQELYRKL
jgi:hypothetical protein